MATIDRSRITHIAFDADDTLWANEDVFGNSLKSDILPIIEIGGQAIHVPYHYTWQHEQTESGVGYVVAGSLEEGVGLLQA